MKAARLLGTIRMWVEWRGVGTRRVRGYEGFTDDSTPQVASIYWD